MMINEKLLPQVEDFTNKITIQSGETPLKIVAWKCNKLVTIIYSGASKTHKGEDVLFNIPEGYRPNTDFWIGAIKTGSVNVASIYVSASLGRVNVSAISSTSATGRLIFQMTYYTN